MFMASPRIGGFAGLALIKRKSGRSDVVWRQGHTMGATQDSDTPFAASAAGLQSQAFAPHVHNMNETRALPVMPPSAAGAQAEPHHQGDAKQDRTLWLDPRWEP